MYYYFNLNLLLFLSFFFFQFLIFIIVYKQMHVQKRILCLLTSLLLVYYCWNGCSIVIFTIQGHPTNLLWQWNKFGVFFLLNRINFLVYNSIYSTIYFAWWYVKYTLNRSFKNLIDWFHKSNMLNQELGLSFEFWLHYNMVNQHNRSNLALHEVLSFNLKFHFNLLSNKFIY